MIGTNKQVVLPKIQAKDDHKKSKKLFIYRLSENDLSNTLALDSGNLVDVQRKFINDYLNVLAEGKLPDDRLRQGRESIETELREHNKHELN